MKRLLAGLLVMALLGACSSHPQATEEGASAPAHATTNALAGTPMAVYGHDLNKARNVQDIVDRQARKQAAAINAATGTTSGGP